MGGLITENLFGNTHPTPIATFLLFLPAFSLRGSWSFTPLYLALWKQMAVFWCPVLVLDNIYPRVADFPNPFHAGTGVSVGLSRKLMLSVPFQHCVSRCLAWQGTEPPSPPVSRETEWGGACRAKQVGPLVLSHPHSTPTSMGLTFLDHNTKVWDKIPLKNHKWDRNFTLLLLGWERGGYKPF